MFDCTQHSVRIFLFRERVKGAFILKSVSQKLFDRSSEPKPFSAFIIPRQRTIEPLKISEKRDDGTECHGKHA